MTGFHPLIRRVCRLSGRLVLLLFLVIPLFLFPPEARTDPGGGSELSDNVQLSDLLEHMDLYDGKVVAVEGEVVGDIMNRAGGSWITVNDDPYALRSLEEAGDFAGLSNLGIGVWISREMARQIRHTGDYREKGDRVRVTGIFHRACRDHGGETDLHADSLMVLEEGYVFDRPFNWKRLIAVLILLVSTAFLWRVRNKVKRMRKRAAR